MKSVSRYGRPCWVIGKPIDHTMSPKIHNDAFRERDLPHKYFALEVSKDELPKFVDYFQGIDALGANLTLPLKQEILDEIDNHSERVSETGAANTIFREGGELHLENTDVHGFRCLVERWEAEICDNSILILGAGGAARSCVRAVKEMGNAQIYLWNRTTERARKLQDDFEHENLIVLTDNELKKGKFEASVVVNATSLGLSENDPSPFPSEQIHSDMIGVDLIYNQETQFLRDFRSSGKDATDGLDMLVHQAAKAWELWTRENAPVEVMRQAVRNEK